MIFTHQIIFEKSLLENDNWINIYNRNVDNLKLRIKRDLLKNNYSIDLLSAIDVFIGGDEYCQCPGCAEHINPIEKDYTPDGNFVVSITFNTDDAERYLEN